MIEMRLLREAHFTFVRTVQTACPSPTSFVRSFEKNMIFMLTDKRGARMLWSTDVLKLENSWIFWLPKKEVPSFALAVNQGCLEDPILGRFLNILGEFFSKK